MPVKASPALVPPTVFSCASEVTPPAIPVSCDPSPRYDVAVTIPLKNPSPEDPKLTPMPGILKLSILASPKVISFDTVAELGSAGIQ